MRSVTAVLVLVVAGCQPQPHDAVAEDTPRVSTVDQTALLRELGKDTSIMQTPEGGLGYVTASRVLARLGIPFEQRLAAVDTGCVLGGKREGAPRANGPRVQRIRCNMRGHGEPLDIELVAEEGWARELRIFQPDATTAQQVIALDLSERFDADHPTLWTIDMDGNGQRELILVDFRAAHNTGYRAWQYSPVERRFSPDTMISAMWNAFRLPGRPCVYEFNSSGWQSRYDGVQCFLGGKWSTLWSTSVSPDTLSRGVVRTVIVRIRDTTHVVRLDSLGRNEWLQ